LDLKGLLKLRKEKVFGLDIGSSAVKAIQLRKDEGGWAVTEASIVDIADETEDNGEHREIDIIRAIRNCLQSTGIQTQLAVCGVCGPQVAVRDFKFPSLPAAEIEGAVRLEAAQVCPFNVEESLVDYQLIANGENSISGILVAATHKLIREKGRLAKDALLDNVLMDVDGLALLNCFSELENSAAGQTTVILNVGASFTNLAIMGENSLPFVRDLACAGNDITKKIAAENGISTETAISILSGRENSGEAQLNHNDSLVNACRKLIVDITETLRYYKAHNKSASVGKIFVCGGFASVEGFVELLNEQLPAEAVLWNPFSKIRCDAGQKCRDILEKNGPAMIVAASLAMRSI